MNVADLVLKGAYSAEEFADAIDELRQKGLQAGASAGWQSLDRFYTVPRGQWTVVTGVSGSGKSTWVDNVMVGLARNEGWKFLVCSPENQPIARHIASLMEIYVGLKFGRPMDASPTQRYVPTRAFMSDLQHKNAYKFICKHFYFINPPETNFTVEGIITIADKVHQEFFKFDGMVLDPYNEIEHRRPQGMLETDYVSWVIQKFRAANRKWNSHFWFVAHPTKPQRMSIKYQSHEVDDEAKKPIYQKITLFDISGSSHWKNKADFGIIVHRDFSDINAPSIIEIEKVRFRENGDRGEVPLHYDYLNNRFIEDYKELLYANI